MKSRMAGGLSVFGFVHRSAVTSPLSLDIVHTLNLRPTAASRLSSDFRMVLEACKAQYDLRLVVRDRCPIFLSQNMDLLKKVAATPERFALIENTIHL